MKCLWIGQGEGCDHAATHERGYCDQHLWRVYQKGTALARRKKDIRRANRIQDIQSEFNQIIQELELEGKIGRAHV